jgi:hypothetical protein
VVTRLFETLNYVSFDEPQLEEVTPDLLLMSQEDANTLIKELENKEISDNAFQCSSLSKSSESQAYCFNHSLFVEIKAYHESTICAEKEFLQAFNYGIKGEKALLITSGELDRMELVESLNNFDQFLESVTKKYRQLAKTVDLRQGQDSWDTRGIYLSALGKIKKFEKKNESWGDISYTRLTNPLDVLKFLTSPAHLGILEPTALYELLIQRNLLPEANLLKNIQKATIEEIMINPTLLYPS